MSAFRVKSFRSAISCGLFVFTAWVAPARAQDPPARERLSADLKKLSSDEFEGRGIGTRGIDLAAEYMRDQMAAAGLEMTAVHGGAFQEFDVFNAAELGSPNTLSVVGPNAERLEAAYDGEFRTCSFSGSGRINAPLVFAGYAIDSQEPAYDDFAGLDLHGKAAIIIRRTPQQGRPGGLFSSPHANGRVADLETKISNAYRRGAVAVVLVNDGYTGRSESEKLRGELELAKDQVISAAEALVTDPNSIPPEKLQVQSTAVSHLRQVREQVLQDDPDPLIEFGYGPSPKGDAIPVFHVKRKLVDQWLQAALGESLEGLEMRIDESSQAASGPLNGWMLDAEANVTRKMAHVKNVLGVLRGTGPTGEQAVIVGAHYDHLGYGEAGSLAPGSHEIHNGADDNGSGDVALLELARHFASHPAPRRTILFIAFTGEERGLLGSADYVRFPVVPLESTVAMINLDMVGRLTDDKLTVFGAETSPVWNDWLDAAADKEHLTLIKKPEGFGPSDHSSFYARQIPVLHLFTGVHSDYHRPSDDWEKINFEGLDRVVAFAEQVIDQCAQAADRPAYVQVAGQAQLDRGGSRPYFGSIPDFSVDQPGYSLSGVSPGSPAEKAGLQAGDVIIRLGDQMIGGIEDFDLALRKFSAGQEVEVVVRRDGQELSLKVTLDKPRS